jgi:uncharacterized membrane protein (UPF0127 family)
MFKQIILPILGVAAFIVIVGLMTQGKINFGSTQQTPKPSSDKFIKIENIQINVEVAKTDSQRQKGLSNRKDLDEKRGMVFVFDKGSRPTFWMKDTLIPLDLIWIRNGKIVGINKNVPTEIGRSDTELIRYPAPGPVDYVLEVNAGFSDKNNIKIDQNLSGLELL